MSSATRKCKDAAAAVARRECARNGRALTAGSTIFEEREAIEQEVQRCRVKIYKLSAKMQRCPYIYEMKERLLGDQQQQPQVAPAPPPPLVVDYHPHQCHQPVATMVKLNADGFGSHTSPTHPRAAPHHRHLLNHHHNHHHHHHQHHQPNDDRDDDEAGGGGGEFQRCYDYHHMFPKNAKTSLFIVMSFVYMKLLVVVCVAYVISDVVTHSIPLWYYEGFFTYLYGVSILFLLYVFCFLLQESACCSQEEGGGAGAAKRARREQAAAAERERVLLKQQQKADEKQRRKEKAAEKRAPKEGGKEGRRKEKKGDKEASAAVVAAAAVADATPRDLEEAAAAGRRRRKTTQSDHPHGSFFLRIGAIGFGLGAMIYNGLECGTFFEVPASSPCYMILRGVNPLLQMVFTFMQMYFIFMNSRLNIHRFKVVARFGLMHVVATNICVWIRTVVLEYLKEVTVYHRRVQLNATALAALPAAVRDHTLLHADAVLGTHVGTPPPPQPTTTTRDPGGRHLLTRLLTTATAPANFYRSYRASPQPNRSLWTTTTSTTTPATTTSMPATSTLTTLPDLPVVSSSVPPASTSTMWDTISSTLSASWPLGSSTESEPTSGNQVESTMRVIAEDVFANGSELLDDLAPQSWWGWSANASATEADSNALLQASCGRANIMGNIVAEAAPYLFPFIVEYALIGAVVIYVMWRHIGRCRNGGGGGGADEDDVDVHDDLEHRLEAMLSRRAAAMAQAHAAGRVDCAGASKGLFFGLLLLVGALICLILFFVLVRHPELGLLAVYLGDVSHCALLALSVAAIGVGFCRVQALRFRAEASGLNDLLLRISAFGLFAYATFGAIAGAARARSHVPSLLALVTGALAVLQVVLQLLFIADASRRRVHLPEHERAKPGRQVVTFLLICNVTMWVIYTFEAQKVDANPIQLDFYGFLTWALVQRLTLPLCIFHRFHSAVTLAEIWKTTYKPRLD